MKTAEEYWNNYSLVITKSSIGKIGLDKNNFTKVLADRDSEIINKIDEMIEISKQQEMAELGAGDDMDEDNLIDHQGRIFILKQLKSFIKVE